MLTDRTKPCHCPPQSMCPQTLEEWSAGEKLPSYIQNVCCKRPYQCTVELISHAGTVCGSYYTTGPEQYQFCMNYAAAPVEGADEDGESEAAEPGSPDVAPSAADIELQTRREVASNLNDCLSNQCAPLLDQVEQLSPEGFSPPNYASGHIINNQFSPNLIVFQQFVACEYACRKTAADTLGVALNQATHSMAPEIENITDWMPSMYSASYRKTVSAPRRLIEFAQSVQGTGSWKASESVRRQRVADYKADHPAPGALKFGGLEGKLTCSGTNSGTMCYGAILNNGSCGSCLVKGTKVSLADGTERAIELIGPGDKVKTDKGDALVLRQVARVWPRLVIHTINDGVLEMTGDHPVMTTNGWRAVDYDANRNEAVEKYGLQDVPALRVGDVLVTRDGTLEVKSITAGPEHTDYQTFNLRLKDGESFYANGVLVKSN